MLTLEKSAEKWPFSVVGVVRPLRPHRLGFGPEWFRCCEVVYHRYRRVKCYFATVACLARIWNVVSPCPGFTFFSYTGFVSRASCISPPTSVRTLRVKSLLWTQLKSSSLPRSILLQFTWTHNHVTTEHGKTCMSFQFCAVVLQCCLLFHIL